MKNILIILTTSFILSSCSNVDKQTENINHTSKDDTLEIVKKYPSGNTREIIYYSENRPVGNIGLNENGDTLKFPSLVSIKGQDSLFAFLPVNKFKGYNIFFGYDSIRAALGTPADFKINGLTNSTVIKITP